MGRESEPDIYVHFQPHALATAKPARRFGSYLYGPGYRRHWPGELAFGAFLHDIGKYFIVPEILLKSGPLHEEE